MKQTLSEKFLFLKTLAIGKANEMVNSLSSMSNQITFDDLKQSVNGIFDTIANSLIVSLKKIEFF